MTGDVDAVWTTVRDVADREARHDLPRETLDSGLWSALDELGFTALAMPAELGGSGGDLLDAAAATGATALCSAPLGEALMIAGPVLAAATLPWPSGVVTAAWAPDVVVEASAPGGSTLTGSVSRVPWLRHADHLVLIVEEGGRLVATVLDVHRDNITVTPGANIAGEPRDDLALRQARSGDFVALPAGWDAHHVQRLGAICRTVQMSAAASIALQYTAEHVAARVQFGRPLIKFQAVQHQLARLAADVATVRLAAESAVRAELDATADSDLIIAAAKAESSSLARVIAAVAHQLLGAIGFSQEHRLGAATTRMWSWREEFGNEQAWHTRIGVPIANGSTDLWSAVTGVKN